MREGDEVNIEQNTYILKELLGQGSYGKVLKGINKSTQQIIAIKIQDSINDDELKVLDMMRRKKHKNLINILNFERIDRKYYIVMEYCKESLYDRIIYRGTIQPDEVRFIMKEIGNGIKEIHDLGYAHRDLKPENILIFQINDNGKTQDLYKICDFGTIKQIDVLKTQKVGTAYYLAPEQVNGQDTLYSQTVDVWAFGALIYELLTGQPLFNGNLLFKLGRNEQEVYIKIKNSIQASIDQKINNCLQIERKYKTLLLNMLQIDIRKRYNINQVVSDLRGTSQVRDRDSDDKFGIKGKPDGRVFNNIQLPNPNFFGKNYAFKPPVVEQQQQKADLNYSRGRNSEQSEPTKKLDFRSPQVIKTSDNPTSIRPAINPSQQFKPQGSTQIASLSQDTKYSQAIHQTQNTTLNQNLAVSKLSNNQKIDSFLQNNGQKQSSFQSMEQQSKNSFQQKEQQQQQQQQQQQLRYQNQIPVQALQNQQKGYFLQTNNQKIDEQQQNQNTNQKKEDPQQNQVVKRPFVSTYIGNQLQNTNYRQQSIQTYDQKQQNNNTIEQQSGKLLNQPALSAFPNQQNNNFLQNNNQKQQNVSPYDQQQQSKPIFEQQQGTTQNSRASQLSQNIQNNGNFYQNNNQNQFSSPYDQQLQNKNNIIQKEETIEKVAVKNPAQQIQNSSQDNNQKKGNQQSGAMNFFPKPQNVNFTNVQNDLNQQQNNAQNKQPLNGNYFIQKDSNNPQQHQNRQSISQNQNNQPQKQIVNATPGSGFACNIRQSSQMQQTPGQQSQQIQSSFRNNPIQQNQQRIGQFSTQIQQRA
ncbi:unnamed protein product (macronuclear) [Paramecium tetraurelia]|uniref:Protein kinase domain-containing protein n=1 Tax=Paramecium tetraurelia TaxID=5888 RepID=A0CSI4_PARTE|nr:uncharacterized protein GSPATT00010023001 [Paramecium tetraurelia]CAK73751.1 unnamed protein product [Paramecium tetraurelia]|eukprot:XP_001441148.1 hypothetical protein (macronuclear) [Paramecium tetraurelia strain d4-2]